MNSFFDLGLSLIKENPLAVGTILLTLYFFYHYILEKKQGVQLSGRYRNAIFETQSKIFLNASQHLIQGKKDLAIKELESAVSLNQESLETYFALGKLFRSNGEIDKAISVHRSIIVKDGISEDVRVTALKELAEDFDRGGFIQKAIDTYKDVLKVNPDQIDVIESICRICELTEDWDEAFKFRLMLSKVGRKNQSETLSHIQVKKAEDHFRKKEYDECQDLLEEAFQIAPSVSAKILKIKLYLLDKSIEEASRFFLDVIREHPDYSTYIMEELSREGPQLGEQYLERLEMIKESFLSLNMGQMKEARALVLAKMRLLDERDKKEALSYLKEWQAKNKYHFQELDFETILLLIELGEKEEALDKTKKLLTGLKEVQTKYYCESCGYNSDEVFWHCPQCNDWESIQFRWKV